MGDIPAEVALSIGAEHPEGPLWDAASARLWWVDITAERVHCFNPQTGNDSSWNTQGQPGGVVLSTAGEPVVAIPEGLALLDRSTGSMELRVPIERNKPGNRANDAKTDARGRVWVGTMAYDKRPRSAALYRVDRGKVTCVAEGLTICNGPAFDEPRGRLYLADTALSIVDLFDLDPATGAVDRRRRFLDFGDDAGLAGRHDRRRRGHAVGCARTGRGRPPLPRRRHARWRGRGTHVEPNLGGLRGRQRR